MIPRRFYPEKNWIRLFSLALAVVLSLAPCLAFDHNHSSFDSELRKFVKKNGVRYAKWKKNRQGLDQYFRDLEKLSADEYEKFNEAQKKALWINVYNALAIRLILDRYPIEGNNSQYPKASIRQIPDVFKAASCNVAGKTISLYVIFHSMMRKDVHDCRTHFAIVPASRGAYPLQAEAFKEKTVDKQLQRITNAVMHNPENLRVDLKTGTIYVSHIFKWFPLDFLEPGPDGKLPFPPPGDDQVVKDYVLKFLSPLEQKRLAEMPSTIVYKDYDWTLNDAK